MKTIIAAICLWLACRVNIARSITHKVQCLLKGHDLFDVFTYVADPRTVEYGRLGGGGMAFLVRYCRRCGMYTVVRGEAPVDAEAHDLKEKRPKSRERWRLIRVNVGR